MYNILSQDPWKTTLLLRAKNELKKKEDDERQYMRQLSVLVNYSTLVSLLPTVAWTALALTQRQVGSLIKEAAGQVWPCGGASSCNSYEALPAPPQVGGTPPAAAPPPENNEMMPSLAFQEVFLRVRRLKDTYGGILRGEDGTMKELL